MTTVSSPERTCDTHVHVFDPARFPYVSPRRFTPGQADIKQLEAHLQRINARRVVLVQPSVYGHDHGCLIDALTKMRGAARGIAVIGPDTGDEDIDRLDAAGVRGARLNLVVDGITDLDFARAAIARASNRIPGHWHIQLHVDLQTLHGLAAGLTSTAHHFVIDHFALLRPQSIGSPEWSSLCDLMASGKITIKLSAPYLCVAPGERLASLGPVVRDLCRTNSHAVVWGTNWPHTQGTARNASSPVDRVEPFRQVDDLAWLRQCRNWLSRLDLPVSTFEDNAERLYGFPVVSDGVSPLGPSS